MKITSEFLKEKSACTDGYRYVAEKCWLGLESKPFIRNLMADKKYDWANWLIVRVMKRKQYLAYAIFAAEQVIGIHENQHPKDDRPRKAIEAAKAILKSNNAKTRDAAWAAGDAAWAAWAAGDAARAAGYAARAAWAAGDAARAAWAAGDAAQEKMQITILNYGLKSLGAK